MKKILAALIIVCCSLAATGCMGLAGNSLTGPSSAQRSDYPADANFQGLAAEKSAGAYPVPTSVSSGIDTKIIKTASVSLEVSNVAATTDALKALAVQRGGYLSSSNVQKGYNNRLTATVVLRIPQSEFENVLESVKAAGTVRSVSTQGEDVTEQYVDLQAQKTSYQNQLAQYNEIMKKAVKVEDVIRVQEQIDRVQTELNRLEGRMRYLTSRIDLSTITVTLQEPEPVGGESGHNFITALNEGIAGFFGMVDAIIVLFFTLLPLAVIGAAGYGIYRWRKNKKTPEPASSETGNT